MNITMFSKADSVKGQGVGSAYLELVQLLKNNYSEDLHIRINSWKRSDISHYHTINFSYYLSTFFSSKRGVKIGYVHFLPETLKGSIELFSPFQKIFNKYVLSFYRRMDELVVVNPSFIPDLIKAGCDEDKITYIPNFVSKEKFYEKSLEEKQSLRKSFGYKQDDFIILGVGQIQKRKGLDDFIQLARDNPEMKFIWAGGFSFGKITDGYSEYEDVYKNPPGNLSFPGIVNRDLIVDYYNLADIFLLPSFNELFPMSILEAFSCSTPVMVRELELYQAVISGYYIGCQDREAMQEKLSELKKNPTELIQWQELSKKASYHYSEKNVGELWDKYYKDMVKKYQ